MRPILKFQSIYLLAIMLVLQACVASNPLAQAETVEQKAYAAYGTFVIFEEQAAKLVSSGQLPRSAVIAIGRADDRAKLIADSLIVATLEFVEIKAEYELGETSESRYVTAMNSLNRWTEQLLPLVNNLISAVKGAQ
jgi:hypothetical protein